jgi:hypothetical protein
MSSQKVAKQPGYPPPGWYEDPSDATRWQWWNGSVWTDEKLPK